MNSSRILIIRFFCFAFSTIYSFGSAIASEIVYVAHIFDNDDKAILVRSSGDAYLVEKGVGCISLWRREGKEIIVHSPGSFLGTGSKLILPEDGQECRVWNAEPIGLWARGAPSAISPRTFPNVGQAQLALNALGYDAGGADGVMGPRTEKALRSFQRDEALPETGRVDDKTVSALAAQLAVANLSTLQQSTPRPAQACEADHWIDEVIADGQYVVLEDGSLWEVDAVDRIDSRLWLRNDEIITCDGLQMINTDSGDRIRVSRVR